MKIFLKALILVVITCVAGLFLGQAFKALFTGESFPMPPPKTVLVTMPFSLP